jgi:hypothetical protein
MPVKAWNARRAIKTARKLRDRPRRGDEIGEMLVRAGRVSLKLATTKRQTMVSSSASVVARCFWLGKIRVDDVQCLWTIVGFGSYLIRP